MDELRKMCFPFKDTCNDARSSHLFTFTYTRADASFRYGFCIQVGFCFFVFSSFHSIRYKLTRLSRVRQPLKLYWCALCQACRGSRSSMTYCASWHPSVWQIRCPIGFLHECIPPSLSLFILCFAHSFTSCCRRHPLLRPS